MIQWEMNIDTALEFWQRVIDRKAETEEERIKILEELAKEGKMNSVSETSRTKKQIVEDKSKHWRILDVQAKDEENQGC